MGMLKITTWGSFPAEVRTFSAEESGHAVAVDDAIRWLEHFRAGRIAQDELLREEGLAPRDGFQEAIKRGLLPPQQKETK